MKKELLISFFSYGLTSALSKFIGVLLLPIYTRYYSNADYGVIDMIQTIITIVMVFGTLQLETSLQRYYYEVEEKDRKTIASTILIFTSVISLLLTVIIQLFASGISLLCFDTEAYASSLIVAAITIPLTTISVVSFIIIRYMKKPLFFAGITLLQVIVTALSTLYFIHIDVGVLAVFYGQGLGYLVLVIIQFIYLRNFYSYSFNINFLKKMLAFALPQFPARLGSVASSYLNRFVMLGVLSISAIGIYSVALKCASAISILQAAFIMSWFPFFYEKLKEPNHKELFKSFFTYICVGVGIVVAFMCLFAKEIITIIASTDFFEAYRLVGGLSLYLSLFIVKEYIDMGPRITKRTSYISYTYVITAIINFVLLYYFTPLTGLEGVVWSMVFTNIFLIVMSWWISERLYYIGFSKIIFVIFIVTALVLVLMTMYWEPSLFIRISLFSVFLVLGGIQYLRLKNHKILNKG